jgi:hypothetical protein
MNWAIVRSTAIALLPAADFDPRSKRSWPETVAANPYEISKKMTADDGQFRTDAARAWARAVAPDCATQKNAASPKGKRRLVRS